MASTSVGVLPSYIQNTEIYFSNKENCIDSNDETVVIKFPSVDFPRIPLISRKKSSLRQGDTGYGTNRIDVTLQCYVIGDRHSDIVRKYMLLQDAFDRNDLHMWYTVNNGEDKIIDGVRVYIDDYSEPSGWKQYDGTFSINIHYFKISCDYDSFGIKAYFEGFNLEGYDPDNVDSQEARTTYNFDPAPLYSAQIEKVNGEPTASEFSPYGEILKQNRIITLSGLLKADHYEDYVEDGVNKDGLKTKMDDIVEAFSRHGVLHYGDWTYQVYIESPISFETTLPHSFVKYSIRLKCHEDEIYELKCTRDFSRIHHHAKVDERLYCLKTEVEEFHESGQYVDYSMTLKAKTREKARELLKKEWQLFVISGGIEMPGGKERWLNDRTIVVTAKKFYLEPVLPNFEDIETQGEDAENILGDVTCYY